MTLPKTLVAGFKMEYFLSPRDSCMSSIKKIHRELSHEILRDKRKVTLEVRVFTQAKDILTYFGRAWFAFTRPGTEAVFEIV